MMRNIFAILLLFVSPTLCLSQGLISVAPNSANAGQTLNVTITGANTNFSPGAGLSVNFIFNQGSGTININSLSVISNTSIIANITVSPSAFTGAYDVSVTDTIHGNLVLSEGFNVNGGITPPGITSIVPNTANAGQTLNVTITGANTNFGQGTFVEFLFGQGSGTINVNSLSVISNTSIVANITVSPSAFTGAYDVSVIEQFAAWFLPDCFNVTGGIAPPVITSVLPNTANAGQTLNVTITGANTHFSQGSGSLVQFEFFQGSGTTVVNSFSALNDTTMIVNITVPASTPDGVYSFYVFNFLDNYLYFTNSFFIGTATSIGPPKQNNKFRLFPNPSIDRIIVENSSGVINESNAISIFNLQGQMKFQRVFSDRKMEIDVSTLPSGTYIINIVGAEGIEQKRFVKE